MIIGSRLRILLIFRDLKDPILDQDIGDQIHDMFGNHLEVDQDHSLNPEAGFRIDKVLEVILGQIQR